MKTTKKTSLKINFIMNAMLTLSTVIFPIITFPYVARVLSPTGIGKVSFATSLVSYFSMFAQLGIPTYGVRACARVRDNREELTRVAHELLFINLIMDLISYAVLVVALMLIPRLREEKTLYMVVSFTIVLTSIGMEWLYKALEQYTYITVRSVIFKFISLILMFLLIREQKDYVIYGGLSVLAASGSYIFNLVNIHKYIDVKPVGSYNLKRHLKPVGVFFAMSCATTIYTHMDTVMLGFMKTDEDVGYYNAAVKVKQILVAVVTSLGGVLLPRVSYYIEKGKLEEFKRITVKAINFVFIVSIPLMIYFMIFAKQGILFLSGSEYFGSIMPMKIIMPTLLLIGISNILGLQILVPLGREQIVLYSELAGLVVNLIVNATLIPRMSSNGAAIGTVLAELTVTVYQVVVLKTETAEVFKTVSYWKIGFATVLAVFASTWILHFEFGNFITLLISAVLFFSVYGLILLLTKESLTKEIFNQVIGKVIKKKC